MRLLLCLILLIMAFPSSVLADTPSVGLVQVKDNNVEVSYTGRSFVNKGKTQYEYKAIISQAPIYNDDGTSVDCAFKAEEQPMVDRFGKITELTKEKTFIITDNIFSLSVTGSEVTTAYEGKTLTWNPVVFVGSQEYRALGEAVVLDTDPLNGNYHNNVLEWDYGVCTRRVRVIEGLIQETFIFNSNPRGTVWIKDNAVKDNGFVWAITPYAYDAEDNSLVINEYKQIMASEFDRAVYPVTIDPTTQYFSSASDGFCSRSGSPYAGVQSSATASSVSTTYTYNICGQKLVSAIYTVYRSALYFDTSALPDDATITAANVSVYGYQDESITDFNMTITNGQPTYPHDPLVVGDYNKSYYSGIGGGLMTTGFTRFGYNNISLNSTGISWISLNSTTKLMIISLEDIIASAPTGAEYISYYTYEKGAGYRPYLEVTYTSSGLPTVVTYPSPSSITETSAVCNGSITSNGSNAITERGICYSLFTNPTTADSTSHDHTDALGNFSFALSSLVAGQTYYYKAYAINVLGTGYGAEYNFTTASNASQVTTNPATYVTLTQARLNGYLNSGGGETCQVRFQYAYWNGTAWVGNTSTANQSKVAGEYFYEDLISLTANTSYAFRAESINSYGQTNGSWLSFNTAASSGSVGSPSTICSASSDTIYLTWTRGANSSQTYIRWKIGGYPANMYDGTLLPLQSGISYAHTGLSAGTSYYYRLWGYDAGNVSTTNTTTMCTTLSSNVSATPHPLPTLDTAGATTAPNGSALTNNPLYTLGNQEAAAIGVPQGTWWMLVGLGGLVVTGLFVYTRANRNLLAAVGAMIMFGVIMANIGIFPIWIMYVFGLAGIGMSWKELR